jgi:hypothetical protein
MAIASSVQCPANVIPARKLLDFTSCYCSGTLRARFTPTVQPLRKQIKSSIDHKLRGRVQVNRDRPSYVLRIIVGVVLATISCALYAHLFGVQLSDFPALSLASDMEHILRLAGPFAFFSLAGLFVPLLPRSARSSPLAQGDTRLGFAAIRLSPHDQSWTADSTSGHTTRLKRTGDYPFAQPYAQRLTCWRGILLNASADPVLDITVANRSSDAFLITGIGIEILSVGCIPERRNPFGSTDPVPGQTAECYSVQMPDTMTPFKNARGQDRESDFFSIDTDLEQTMELSEPFYLRAAKSFRFELRLEDFGARTPLHALGRIVLHTDGGVFRSPAIYFRR